MSEPLVYRLRKRAEIRLQAQGRKSVEEGIPDRLAELLVEAADRIAYLERYDPALRYIVVGETTI